MSRYLLLVLLNLPLVLLAITGAITRYKLKHSSKHQMVMQITLWSIVLIGLSSAQIIYSWLFNNKLTETEPLSLFDVVQITAIIVLLFVVNRLRIKLDDIDQKLQALHREISINLSEKTN